LFEGLEQFVAQLDALLMGSETPLTYGITVDAFQHVVWSEVGGVWERLDAW